MQKMRKVEGGEAHSTFCGTCSPVCVFCFVGKRIGFGGREGPETLIEHERNLKEEEGWGEKAKQDDDCKA